MDAEASTLAGSVRQLRAERQWTLDHAAARLGISRRLLTQIEAGEANPSLSTMLSVANGFDVHLTDLLDAGQSTTTPDVNHDPGTAPVLWSTANGSAARLLVGQGPLELWSWTLAPGDERSSDAHHADSMEALHVLKGSIEIEIGPELVRLGPGGSAVFATSSPHIYRNPTRRPAAFLLTVFDPAA